jgi:hypothetical protein
VAASVTFHRDASGAVTSLTLHQNGDHPATRLDAAPASEKPDLTRYAGRYFSAELEVFYELKVEGETLVATGRHTLPVTLRHGKGETFSGACRWPTSSSSATRRGT